MANKKSNTSTRKRKKPLKKELEQMVLQLQKQCEEQKTQLEELSQKYEQERDRLLRALASEQNLRRRLSKEQERLRWTTKEQILSSLLPVLDNFELALHSKESSEQSLKEGVELIFRQLSDVLSSFGVSEIECLGEEFDPKFHEAVGKTKSSEMPPGKVAEIVQKGLLLNGKLLRPSKVVVSEGEEER